MDAASRVTLILGFLLAVLNSANSQKGAFQYGYGGNNFRDLPYGPQKIPVKSDDGYQKSSSYLNDITSHGKFSKYSVKTPGNYENYKYPPGMYGAPSNPSSQGSTHNHPNGMNPKYPKKGIHSQYPQAEQGGNYPDFQGSAHPSQSGLNPKYPQKGIHSQYPQTGQSGKNTGFQESTNNIKPSGMNPKRPNFGPIHKLPQTEQNGFYPQTPQSGIHSQSSPSGKYPSKTHSGKDVQSVNKLPWEKPDDNVDSSMEQPPNAVYYEQPSFGNVKHYHFITPQSVGMAIEIGLDEKSEQKFLDALIHALPKIFYTLLHEQIEQELKNQQLVVDPNSPFTEQESVEVPENAETENATDQSGMFLLRGAPSSPKYPVDLVPYRPKQWNDGPESWNT